MTIAILSKKYDESASDALLANVSKLSRKKQRRHEFWILSCYLEISCLKKAIAQLQKTVRLKVVYLAFNYSEIFKKGPIQTETELNTVESWCRANGIDFEWKLLASSQLVHSKGYAVIQRWPNSEEIYGGCALITSANFSHSGFFGKNIELGYSTLKRKEVKEFEREYNRLWHDLGVDIGDHIVNQEKRILRYSILASGLFLHKWSGSLSQFLGVHYKLTDLAKKRGTIAPELAILGFEAGDTFTRQLIDLESMPEKKVPSKFIRSFTIETKWGRWCPKEAWESIRADILNYDEFISHFKATTKPEALSKIKDKARETEITLIQKGLIKKVSKDHLNNWEKNILLLRENTIRLDRLFTGYDANSLPYKYEDKRELDELFNSLTESINISKKKNKCMTKVNKTLSEKNIDHLKLNGDEREYIQTL